MSEVPEARPAFRACAPVASATVADPLLHLVRLPGVSDAADAARDALAAVHRHPANRRGWPATATEASVRGARASAAIEGASTQLPADGRVTDPVLAGALRVGQALDGDGLANLVRTWSRAPLQVLARLHLLAAADLVADEAALGRPRPDAGERLDLLAQVVVSSTAPAPVIAGVVHGELLALRPFGAADGVVARAASRLVAVSTGLDPHNLGVPEVAWLRHGPEYAAAAAHFSEGSSEGVGAWLLLCSTALEAGAREAKSIADSVG